MDVVLMIYCDTEDGASVITGYIPRCQVILEGSRSRRTKVLTSCGVREAGSVLLIPKRWK